jgi:hypothetical protein
MIPQSRGLGYGAAVGSRARRGADGFWAWNLEGSTSNNKNYDQYQCKKGEGHDISVGGVLTSSACAEGDVYKAWVWGHAWAGNYWFDGPGQVSSTWTCANAPYGTVREFSELAFG